MLTEERNSTKHAFKQELQQTQLFQLVPNTLYKRLCVFVCLILSSSPVYRIECKLFITNTLPGDLKQIVLRTRAESKLGFLYFMNMNNSKIQNLGLVLIDYKCSLILFSPANYCQKKQNYR